MTQHHGHQIKILFVYIWPIKQRSAQVPSRYLSFKGDRREVEQKKKDDENRVTTERCVGLKNERYLRKTDGNIDPYQIRSTAQFAK